MACEQGSRVPAVGWVGPALVNSLAADKVVNEALDLLHLISPQDLLEVRKLPHPPLTVQCALEVTYLILEAAQEPIHRPTPPSWEAVQKTLSSENFLHRVQSFDVHALRASPALVNFLCTEYFQAGSASKWRGKPDRFSLTANAFSGKRAALEQLTEPLTVARVSRASRVVGDLLRWCEAVLANVAGGAPSTVVKLETPRVQPRSRPLESNKILSKLTGDVVNRSDSNRLTSTNSKLSPWGHTLPSFRHAIGKNGPSASPGEPLRTRRPVAHQAAHLSPPAEGGGQSTATSSSAPAPAWIVSSRLYTSGRGASKQDLELPPVQLPQILRKETPPRISFQTDRSTSSATTADYCEQLTPQDTLPQKRRMSHTKLTPIQAHLDEERERRNSRGAPQASKAFLTPLEQPVLPAAEGAGDMNRTPSKGRTKPRVCVIPVLGAIPGPLPVALTPLPQDAAEVSCGPGPDLHFDIFVEFPLGCCRIHWQQEVKLQTVTAAVAMRDEVHLELLGCPAWNEDLDVAAHRLRTVEQYFTYQELKSHPAARDKRLQVGNVGGIACQLYFHHDPELKEHLTERLKIYAGKLPGPPKAVSPRTHEMADWLEQNFERHIQ